MKSIKIYILGVGHNTEVYIDLIESCGFQIMGLFHYNDDRTNEKVLNIPIIDSNENLFKRKSLKGMNFAISVGNNEIRTDLANQIIKKGGKLPSIIHPTAIVSKYANISEGVVIHANSVVQSGVTISKNSVVSYNTSVTHNCSIGASCYLAAGSNIGAYIKIYDNVLIGQSAVLISSKVRYIGKNSVIGAGSIVTRSVETNLIVAGNPAKLLKKLKK